MQHALADGLKLTNWGLVPPAAIVDQPLSASRILHCLHADGLKAPLQDPAGRTEAKKRVGIVSQRDPVPSDGWLTPGCGSVRSAPSRFFRFCNGS